VPWTTTGTTELRVGVHAQSEQEEKLMAVTKQTIENPSNKGQARISKQRSIELDYCKIVKRKRDGNEN
jgi:hypothetical protein